MEFKTLEDYRKFIELNRKLGVKTFKISQNEVSGELADEALMPKTPYQLKKEAEETKRSIQDAHANSIVEAERALMWSSTIPDQETH